MKIAEAIKIGKECGLETPEECVNNILIHAHMYFGQDMFPQCEELLADMRQHEAELASHYEREEGYEDERVLIEDDKFKEGLGS